MLVLKFISDHRNIIVVVVVLMLKLGWDALVAAEHGVRGASGWAPESALILVGWSHAGVRLKKILEDGLASWNAQPVSHSIVLYLVVGLLWSHEGRGVH
jgi:hypothetical protein